MRAPAAQALVGPLLIAAALRRWLLWLLAPRFVRWRGSRGAAVRLVQHRIPVTIPALSSWLLLAQEVSKGATDANAVPPQQAPPGLSSMLPALLGIVALFYFLILRP